MNTEADLLQKLGYTKATGIDFESLNQEELSLAEKTGLAKVCSKCEKLKLFLDFPRDRRGKDGYRAECKECRAKYNRNYGQVNEEVLKAKRTVSRASNPRKIWVYRTVANHKGNGYKILFTYEQLRELAQNTKTCSICGTQLNWVMYTKGGRPQPNSPSLDRTDQDCVLTIQNIQIVCHKCNVTKNNRTMQEFIDYCKLVASRF